MLRIIQTDQRGQSTRHKCAHAAIVLSAALILALTSCPGDAIAREMKPAPPVKHEGFARHAMVAAANPLAVQTGVDVLRAGGSAVDAAVAVQAVLGLVEPQSSGIGGGAFMVYYDAKSHQVLAYDGREVAPARADGKLFIDDNGRPLPFFDAVLGGRSTGVPGAIAMLEMAHKAHGRLPWARLFRPAERLAASGFIVSPRLAGMIALTGLPQPSAPDALRYFTKPDGSKYQAGDVLKNPAYAATLRTIATKGEAGLLTGTIAQDIVTRVHEAPLESSLTLDDLAHYKPRVTAALCRAYHSYRICTPQAPSGGPGVLEALGILEHTPIARHPATDPQGWYLFAQANRLAYADRDRYIADPAFVSVPTAGLLDTNYDASRAALIGDQAGPVTFGHPDGAPQVADDKTTEPGGTSHIVIVDARGNVVSMTTTVESIFGSGRMVDGFFLNNQLTDFSFSPTQADGTAAANAPAAGKRPRSTMAPAIILDSSGKFYAAVGSPGGSAIQAYVTKAIVAMLDWHLSPQDAVALPNLVAHGDSYSADAFPTPIATALAARGMTLSTGRGENSGLQAVVVKKGGYEGGADPRREGIARGF